MNAEEGGSTKDDVALITGGSRGIGEAVAIELADRGVGVCCTGRSIDDLDAVVSACREKGARAMSVLADQRDDEAIRRSVDACESELGPITMLINNAGMARPAHFLNLEDDELEDEFRMNLLAPVAYLRNVGRLMTSRKEGVVVNVASNRGLRGSSQLAAYSAAKAGLIHLTRCLAKEWARFNVRVNAVCPGATATSMNERARQSQEVVDRVVRDIPLGRYARPEEVARLITYLLLPDAAMITGATYVIDGGEVA